MNDAESLAQAILDHLENHPGTRTTRIAALAIAQHTLVGSMRPPQVLADQASDRAAGAAQPRRRAADWATGIGSPTDRRLRSADDTGQRRRKLDQDAADCAEAARQLLALVGSPITAADFMRFGVRHPATPATYREDVAEHLALLIAHRATCGTSTPLQEAIDIMQATLDRLDSGAWPIQNGS